VLIKAKSEIEASNNEKAGIENLLKGAEGALAGLAAKHNDGFNPDNAQVEKEVAAQKQ